MLENAYFIFMDELINSGNNKKTIPYKNTKKTFS